MLNVRRVLNHLASQSIGVINAVSPWRYHRVRGNAGTPGILLLVQFRNERSGLPDFFLNVLPHVDAIIGLNDGSDDGSGEYFEAHPKVLEVIHRPVRHPHTWDEPANREALLQAAARYCPQWILALDVDERLERDFRCKVQPYLVAARRLNCHSISQPLREIWDSPDIYRCDGIWNKKRRVRLFRWSADHQVDQAAFHGTWVSVKPGTFGHTIRSPLPIYHLGMLTETQRRHRVQKYEELDPGHEFQSIGYAYLNEKDGLRLRHVDPDRSYKPPYPTNRDNPANLSNSSNSSNSSLPILALHGQSGFLEALTRCIERVSAAPDVLQERNSSRQAGSDQLHQLQQLRKLQHALYDCLGHLSREDSLLLRWFDAARFRLSRSGASTCTVSLSVSSDSVPRSFVLAGCPGSVQNALIGSLCRLRGYRVLPLAPIFNVIGRLQDAGTRQMICRSLWCSLMHRFPTGVIFQMTDSVTHGMGLGGSDTNPGGIIRCNTLIRACRTVRIRAYLLTPEHHAVTSRSQNHPVHRVNLILRSKGLLADIEDAIQSSSDVKNGMDAGHKAGLNGNAGVDVNASPNTNPNTNANTDANKATYGRQTVREQTEPGNGAPLHRTLNRLVIRSEEGVDAAARVQAIIEMFECSPFFRASDQIMLRGRIDESIV